MSHCVLHDPADAGAVVVVDGVKDGMPLTGLILAADRALTRPCARDLPCGHKVALEDRVVGGHRHQVRHRHRPRRAADRVAAARACPQHRDEAVASGGRDFGRTAAIPVARGRKALERRTSLRSLDAQRLTAPRQASRLSRR